VKMLNGYMKTCCPNNITGAFQRAGIATYWSPEYSEILARVDRESATEVRDWRLGKDRIPLRTARTFSPEDAADESDAEYERNGEGCPLVC
jgi:hypothetical protein